MVHKKFKQFQWILDPTKFGARARARFKHTSSVVKLLWGLWGLHGLLLLGLGTAGGTDYHVSDLTSDFKTILKVCKEFKQFQ